jgi:Na+-translocating ferredoxin:NAD+ oxidoreductase RnfG subunit
VETATTVPEKKLQQPPLKPYKKRVPAKAGPISKAVRYAAYLSLLAAFIIGMTSEGKDYEAMVQEKFEGQNLTKVNDDPVVFQIGEKKSAGGEYILIQEGQGYGGPFVLGIRINDDAKVHEILPLDDKETPAFIKMVKEADYRAQFIGKSVTDNFIVGNDIDAVSGATVTTMAATQAVRNGAHIAAVSYFKLDPKWQKVPWKFGLGEILILVIFTLAFVPKITNQKPWKYLYLAATISIVGFYLNAAVSIGSLSGLMMGYIPGASEHLTWWILVIGTVLGILLLGKNVYCFKICPFYGIEFLLNKISGSKLNPTPEVLRQTRKIANFLLWLSLMIIFLAQHPAAGAYEPFAMMFSLEGIGIQWYILPLAIIGSFFTSTFWCRFFCPAGNALGHLLKVRKKTLALLRKG